MKLSLALLVVACSPSSSGYPPYSNGSGVSDAPMTRHDGAAIDAQKPDAPVPKGFSCTSCEPSTQGSGSGCVETIGLVITCTNYTLPTETQRVTLTDAHGSDSTSLATVSCGTTYQTYNLAVGSSGTCTDADIVHVSKIETTDTPPLEVTCAYDATTCGSGG